MAIREYCSSCASRKQRIGFREFVPNANIIAVLQDANFSQTSVGSGSAGLRRNPATGRMPPKGADQSLRLKSVPFAMRE
jgi:hypothetical protein